MLLKTTASRLRSLLRLPQMQWSAPPWQPQPSAGGDAIAALRFATSASPPADDGALHMARGYVVIALTITVTTLCIKAPPPRPTVSALLPDSHPVPAV